MAKYKYPNTMPPSLRILLGQHQHPTMELDTVMRLVYARTLPLDTSAAAVAALHRATIEKADRDAGRVDRLWVDDLRAEMPDPAALAAALVVQE